MTRAQHKFDNEYRTIRMSVLNGTMTAAMAKSWIRQKGCEIPYRAVKELESERERKRWCRGAGDDVEGIMEDEK